MQSLSTLTPSPSNDTNIHVTQLFAAFTQVCAPPLGTTADIITVVIDPKHRLGKQFSVNAAGGIDKKAAVSISRGIACQFYVPDLDTLEAVFRLVSENPHAAIINAGWRPVPVGQPFVFLSKKALQALDLDEEAITADQGMLAFARLKVHATPSSWQLMDRDEDKFTPDWAKKQSFDDWCRNVDQIFPGFAQLSKLGVGSNSTRVQLPDGTPVGVGNAHWWFKVVSAADIERARTAIRARSLEFDLAWKKPSISKTTGEECGSGFATIIDASVWTLGRLVFEGSPSVTGNLRIVPQKFERIVGTLDALDTTLATINAFETVRASMKQGVKLHLTPTLSATGQITSYRTTVANLTLETELELEDGSWTTVQALLLTGQKKVRCQAPFRASMSMAAFYAVNEAGEPFVFDSGTDTLHVLGHSMRKPDPDCDQLVREIRRELTNLLGKENAEIVFDEDQVRAAWEATFYSPEDSKIMLVNKNDDLIELSTKDALDFGFKRDFGRFFDYPTLKLVLLSMKLKAAEAKTLRKEVEDLEYRAFIQMLKLYKQAKSLALSVDIFAKHGNLTVMGGVATINLPHHALVPKMMVDPALVAQVVADYVQHFPEFEDFVNLVLHARFASDRRQAFVWLHAVSSWGKGFLQSIFADLGLVVDISVKEIEKLLEGGPVGLEINQMLRAWILFVDEFKAASSELKLLNTQISMAPKHQLRSTVQLYTKLFASAENVRSLVGDGVESQFNNRFAYLCPSTQGQKLEDRLLFQTLGKMQYIGALTCHVANVLNKGVETFRAVGPIVASRQADEYLKTYQAAHRLDEMFGNLDETVDEVVAEIKQCLIDYAYWVYPSITETTPPLSVQGIGTLLQNTLKRSAAVGYISKGDHRKERDFAIVLPDAEKFIKAYVALSGDRSTVGKMQYKSDTIAAKLHMRPDSPKGKFRVYSAPELGYQVADKRGIVVFG